MRRVKRRLLREQQGASTVVVALCMAALLIVLALVVDIGATAARRAQLQDAADAAALALAQQCYEAAETRTEPGCAPEVQTGARDTATAVARATMNDGLADLTGEPDLISSPERVTVSLSSDQAALFSWAAGADGQVVVATATAEWRQTVALPLAMTECIVPEADTETVEFLGTGLYTGVQQLLQSLLSVGMNPNVPEYLERVLVDCGLNVLSGGWLGTLADDSCRYDPNALTTVTSTLERLLPINNLVPGACSNTIQNLVGKRIVVPVFASATGQLLDQVVGGIPTVGQQVDRLAAVSFTEIIVTGYEFDGVLGLGDVEDYDLHAEPSCASVSSLSDLLGLPRGLTKGLLDALLGGLGEAVGAVVDNVVSILSLLLDALVVRTLLNVLNLCQGIQGKVVATGMDAAQAAERLVPYRLVA